MNSHHNPADVDAEDDRAYLLHFLKTLEQDRLPQLSTYGPQYKDVAAAFEAKIQAVRSHVEKAPPRSLQVQSVYVLWLLRSLVLSIAAIPGSDSVKAFIIHVATGMDPADELGTYVNNTLH